jgi:hypothetical protein
MEDRFAGEIFSKPGRHVPPSGKSPALCALFFDRLNKTAAFCFGGDGTEGSLLRLCAAVRPEPEGRISP